MVREANASDLLNPFLIANLRFFKKLDFFSKPEEVIQKLISCSAKILAL